MQAIRQYLQGIIPNFFEYASPDYVASSRSVTVAGLKVFSYRTCIASLDVENNVLYLNREHYSCTTSHLQNVLRALAHCYEYNVVEVDENDAHLSFRIQAVSCAA